MKGAMRTVLFSGLLLAGLVASRPGRKMPPAESGPRRDSLAARIDSGVVIAFGIPDPTGINQSVQLPAFRYLTGFLEPNAALLLVKSGGKVTGTLFTSSRDPRRA